MSLDMLGWQPRKHQAEIEVRGQGHLLRHRKHF